MSDDETLVRIGRVIKPHGIGGELVVEPVGASLAHLSVDDEIRLEGVTAPRRVLGARPHARRWLVSISEVSNRTDAEALRGRWLSIPDERLPQLHEGEAYVDDLVGCTLEGAGGEPIGEIVDVRAGHGQDLLEVRTAAGSQLVPMAADWLVELDLEGRRLRMDLPEGLLVESPAGAPAD